MRLTFTALALATWSVAAMASPPALPAADGPYAVGVRTFAFVDATRTLDGDAVDGRPRTGDAPASGPRRLPAIAWYPAERGASGDAPYLAGEAATVTLPAIARNFGYAPEDLQAMRTLRMAVHADARPARVARGFPVVVFSHGFFLYPQQNSALAARLASHGYIVVSIAHPGDAADLPLADGRIAPTRLAVEGDDPRFAEALNVLVTGQDLAVRREALATYATTLPATRIGRSFAQWRDDTLAVAHAIVDGNEPEALRMVLASADRRRLAFAGMSFGGATSATSCRLVDACRAAVNLDGQNFDPALYDGAVERPLLLMLSDWTQFSLFPGQPKDADFSPNDLAYAPWREAGQDTDVLRVRLGGTRHLGFTDFVSLLQGPKRDERVGDIDAGEATAAIGDLVLAFLDTHVRESDGDGARDGIEHAIARHPALTRHVPTRVRAWVQSEGGTP